MIKTFIHPQTFYSPIKLTDMTKDFNEWLDKVNNKRQDYWNSKYTHKEYTPLKKEKGRKYMKLIDGTTVWGFVCMVDGMNKGVSVKVGDLLMPANWSTPSKHSRGNIFEGTDSWGFHGPTYLKG
jgi:hypothetical protein